MFYNMYITSNLSLSELFENILKALPKGEVSENEASTLCVVNDGFSFWVESDPIPIGFANEDYNANFDCNFYIDVFLDYPAWKDDFLNFINELLLKFKGNFLLLFNGDVPVVFRRETKVYINEKIIGKNFNFDYDEKLVNYIIFYEDFHGKIKKLS